MVGRLEGYFDVHVERPVILKYSLAGKTLWKHASGTLGSINDMLVDAKGRVVMVGHTWSTAWGEEMQVGLIEMWTPSGQGDPRDATWAADFGPGTVYPAEFNRVVAGPDGRLYIAGDIGTSLTFGEGNAAVFAWPPSMPA